MFEMIRRQHAVHRDGDPEPRGGREGGGGCGRGLAGADGAPGRRHEGVGAHRAHRRAQLPRRQGTRQRLPQLQVPHTALHGLAGHEPAHHPPIYVPTAGAQAFLMDFK
jgi:hypothetical protein